MIEAASFRDGQNLAAMLSHLRFVRRDHHRRIRRVALVSDNTLLTAAPKIASYFVSAELRTFDAAGRAAERSPGSRPALRPRSRFLRFRAREFAEGGAVARTGHRGGRWYASEPALACERRWSSNANYSTASLFHSRSVLQVLTQ